MLFSAAACYHLAGYMHHDLGRLLPKTKRSMLQAVQMYWEAAPLFLPPSTLVFKWAEVAKAARLQPK